MSQPDIDIDVSNPEAVMKLFPTAVWASMLTNDKKRIIQHKSGMYLQNIPRDPDTNLSTFTYDLAEEHGFFKFDILMNKTYQMVESNADLDELLAMPTDWSWYLDERLYEGIYPLVHLRDHFKMVQKHPPKSISDLAMLVAMIRPGKKYLIGKPKEQILKEIWEPSPEEDFVFKKSHSFAYAVLVSVHAKILAIQLGLI